jgi:hypothetical protein
MSFLKWMLDNSKVPKHRKPKQKSTKMNFRSLKLVYKRSTGQTFDANINEEALDVSYVTPFPLFEVLYDVFLSQSNRDVVQQWSFTKRIRARPHLKTKAGHECRRSSDGSNPSLV